MSSNVLSFPARAFDVTSSNFMVIGLQIRKLQRGAESPPSLAVLDSKKPGLFRVKKIGVCGAYFLISIAEIRYRHDWVRLCHKFHFCPFQIKIPHIDEEKELYCVSYPGLCVGFFVLGDEGSRSQKILEPRRGEKNFFRARRESRGMLP